MQKSWTNYVVLGFLTGIFVFGLRNTIKYSQQAQNDKIFWDNYDNVIRVEASGNPMAHGTGIIVNTSKGKQVVLTNGHVCEAFSQSPVLNNTLTTQKSNILYVDILSDLCIIEVPKKLEVRAIPLAEKEPRMNQELFSIGYPLGHDKNLLSGRGIGLNTVPMHKLFQGQVRCPQIVVNNFQAYCLTIEQVMATNVVLFPGGSGSPVFNLNNELVGLMSLTSPGSNFGHMVLLSDIKRVLDLY